MPDCSDFRRQDINKFACNLYAKLGFQEVYQYVYRMK